MTLSRSNSPDTALIIEWEIFVSILNNGQRLLRLLGFVVNSLAPPLKWVLERDNVNV
jgi:hypothetical protein